MSSSGVIVTTPVVAGQQATRTVLQAEGLRGPLILQTRVDTSVLTGSSAPMAGLPAQSGSSPFGATPLAWSGCLPMPWQAAFVIDTQLGSVARTWAMDFRSGTWQLPPCDMVRVSTWGYAAPTSPGGLPAMPVTACVTPGYIGSHAARPRYTVMHTPQAGTLSIWTPQVQLPPHAARWRQYMEGMNGNAPSGHNATAYASQLGPAGTLAGVGPLGWQRAPLLVMAVQSQIAVTGPWQSIGPVGLEFEIDV